MEQKRTLPARQIVSEIKSGATDDEIMLKYNLTAEDLKVFFGKLLQLGLITQADLEQRPTRFEDKFDLDFEDEGPVNNGVSVSEITSDTHDTEGLVESSQSQTTPYMGGQSKESKLTSERSDDVRKQEVESSSKPTGESPTEQLAREQIAAGNVITSCSDTELSSIGGQSNEPKLTSDKFSSEIIETIVLVFVLPPLGLYRLWKSSQFKQILKVVLTTITTIIWLIVSYKLIILWGLVMLLMSMLLLLLVFVFFICLIIGLIRPTIFSRFLRGEVTRKKTATIFTIATVVSFVLFGITVENTPKTEKQKSKSEPTTENTSNQVTKRNSAEKPAKESQPSRVRELPQQATSPTPDKIEKTPQVEAKKSNRSQELNQIITPSVPEKTTVSKQVPDESVICTDSQDCFNTGLKYYKSQNYSEAFRCYSKAADQGNVEAQKALAIMYYGGQGVNQNYAESLKWNRKAADQGDAEAQKRLGLMYYNGIGVTKDLDEGVKWYRKSANQGDTDARVLLERAEQVLQAVNTPETEKQKTKSEPTAENTSNQVMKRNSSEKPSKEQAAIKTSSGELKSDNKLTKADTDEIAIIAKKVYDRVSGEKEIKQLRRFLNGEVDVNDRYDETGSTILMGACHALVFEEKAAEMVAFFLAKGADVNARNNNGWTPLMFASIYQRREAVKLLLADGADVNARDKDGKSALLKVCMLPKKDEEVEMVKLFLDRGADANAKDKKGWTPLMTASRSGHSNITKLLLDRGADVNAKDNMGNTALTMASMLDHLEVAKLLLAKGADVNIEGVGYPMPYAKPEMAKLLKEYGAVDKPR